MDPAVSRLDVLVRQLQGMLGGRSVYAAIVGGLGGSGYTLAAGTAGLIVSGLAVGVCRVTLPVDASPAISFATVQDNGAYFCSTIVVTETPATIDVYQWDSAGAAANRSFSFLCLAHGT